MVKFGFTGNKFSVELHSMFQALKRLEDMSPYGEDNDDKGTAEGFPAWNNLNVKTIYNLNKNLSLRFSIENVFDQMYRPFASGVSAPGRSFIFSISYGIE